MRFTWADKGNMTYIDDKEIKLTDGGTNNRRPQLDGERRVAKGGGDDVGPQLYPGSTLRSSDSYRPGFGFGVSNTSNLPGLHFAFHDGTAPCFRPLTAVASGAWLADSGNRRIGSAAFPLNEKCHVAFTVTPDGTGNAIISAYIHKADGTLVGSGAWPIGSWTTSRIVQNAFMLGRGIYNNDNPQANYDEVRVWKIALTREQVEESIRLGPDTLPAYAYPPACGFMIFVE